MLCAIQTLRELALATVLQCGLCVGILPHGSDRQTFRWCSTKASFLGADKMRSISMPRACDASNGSERLTSLLLRSSATVREERLSAVVAALETRRRVCEPRQIGEETRSATDCEHRAAKQSKTMTRTKAKARTHRLRRALLASAAQTLLVSARAQRRSRGTVTHGLIRALTHCANRRYRYR